MIPRNVRSILVVRLSARGDLVFASPLAGALRRRHPGAHIAWVAEERTADVVLHNPHLDEVIVWERGAWKRLLRRGRWGTLAREVVDFFASLRERRFDVAIDTQGLLRSGLVAFLSGAPVRIGLGSREGSGVLMTRVVERGGNEREIASEYRHLAEVLGLPTDRFAMEIPRGADETAKVAAMLKKAGLTGDFVAVCPFTTRDHKHWFEDRWSALIELVRARVGVGVALLGGPGDRAAADRILGGVADSVPDSPPLIDLVGRTTLGEAAAVVSRCSGLVGVDTGLSHMAHAFGRPAVLLFGSNTPYLDPPGPAATILHSGRACSPCRGKLVCDGRIDCMRDIGGEQVIAALESRLGGSPAPRSAAGAAPLPAAGARRPGSAPMRATAAVAAAGASG